MKVSKQLLSSLQTSSTLGPVFLLGEATHENRCQLLAATLLLEFYRTCHNHNGRPREQWLRLLLAALTCLNLILETLN